MKNLEDLEYDDSPERPSKSQRKRDMHALQDMGAELVELSPERLARIDMPEPLRGAIREAQRLTRHEARRRQLQYIGRLMRDADPAPIREALDAVKGASAIENARQHRLERLRERLLQDEAVLTEIGAAHPGADITRLRQLRRSALKDRDEGRPPRAFRELFRLLRELDHD
ncbi:MAG: ribosome biogenesis factor YjgA [Denitratisoma sp.]|nr:ribosome biogenesis factor YjgA [Denitratisoma sp.]